LNPLDPYA
jgi:hypothetical protein